MRKSRRELTERWLSRRSAAERAVLTADQALRDDPAELNPKKRRGAPVGNRNRFVHGRYTRERDAFRAEVRAYVSHSRQMVAAVRAGRLDWFWAVGDSAE